MAMGYQLDSLFDTAAADGNGDAPGAAELRRRIERLYAERRRYRRLWAYYRNPMAACTVGGGDLGAERPYRQAQEWGLPSRITGARPGGELLRPEALDGVARKEVVIENDIGWRVDTNVDYLFGRTLVVESAAPDPRRRAVIGRLMRAILAQNGGILFLQQAALLGAVYGFVDILVKLVPPGPETEPLSAEAAPPAAAGEAPAGCGTQDLGEPPPSSNDRSEFAGPPHEGEGASAGGQRPAAPPDGNADPAATGRHGGAEGAPGRPPCSHDSTEAADVPPDALIARVAQRVRLEIVEPARALPLLCPQDYRVVMAYAQVYEMPRADGATRGGENGIGGRDGWLARVRRSARSLWGASGAGQGGLGPAPARGGDAGDAVRVVEVITATGWQRYEDEALVAAGANSLGEIPLVHVQNTAVPFEYAGDSDVEPLIPLQDELNTRLSDRASRITLQSFKMYLGKGIEHFTELPVAPGRMWTTDNERADVIEFGGDANAPSEALHIQDVREAMDKISAVTPIAAGAIKGRIGRLTSAAALRITLLALLSKTERKRTTYGAGVRRMLALSLAWLDRAGLFPTTPEERAVDLHWPSPLPENDGEKLDEAQAKLRIGVPPAVVLKELGYGAP